MPCESPFIKYRAGQKVVKKTFLNDKIHRDKPIIYSQDVVLPCGRCPSCQKRRINDWNVRLIEEDKVSSSSYFVTLTYDRDHIPLTKSKRATLWKRHYQLFMKKLRKLQRSKIKYYAVGEYGDERMRPHYHAIMFNVENVDYIEQAWEHGLTHIGTVSGDSIAYTCKYIAKEKKIPQYESDDRQKEFSLMSKGLGKSYINDEIIKYHKDDLNRTYIVRDGYKISLPRYYRDRIYTEKEKERIRELAANSAGEREVKEKNRVKELYGDKIDFVHYQEENKINNYFNYYKLSKIRKDV